MSEPILDLELAAHLDTMNIAELRKTAKLYNVALSREMTADDIKAAIQRKKSKHNLVVEAVSDKPAPGRWRIIVHKTSEHGAAVGSRPVFVKVNGFAVNIPRNVPVDVPEKVVRVLESSVHFVPVEGADGHTRGEAQLSYPFQVVDHTPGPDPVPGYEKTKARMYARRVAFRDEFGYWPRNQAMLREAEEKGLIGPRKRFADSE
jgi:hypothetical protein